MNVTYLSDGVVSLVSLYRSINLCTLCTLTFVLAFEVAVLIPCPFALNLKLVGISNFVINSYSYLST